MESRSEAPEGLHELQYARHVLEETLAWPATKSNLELVGGAIASLSKRYRVKLSSAFNNLVERIEEARKQEMEITGHFFRDGEYMNVRRQQKDVWAIREKFEAQFAEHGCMNGWVYVEKGVVRCQKCVGRK